MFITKFDKVHELYYVVLHKDICKLEYSLRDLKNETQYTTLTVGESSSLDLLRSYTRAVLRCAGDRTARQDANGEIANLVPHLKSSGALKRLGTEYT
jgi:hypothetical protein